VTIAAFGYPVAFVANAASFLAVVVALFFVQLSAPSGRSEPIGLLASLREGARAALAEPACRAAIGTIAVVALLASPFIALVPVMAHRLTHTGARGIASATGLLTTAQGLGAVAGALVIAPLAARVGRGRLLTTSLVALPPVLVLYGFAPSLTLALPALFSVGLVYLGVLSGLSTVVQLRAPAEVRGRVLSLYLVALGVAYPIGSLIQGPLADSIGLAWTTAGGGALLALALGAARLIRPGIFKTLASPASTEAPTVTA
jgi:MFS family permease